MWNPLCFPLHSLNSISSEEAKRQSVKSMGSDSSSSGPSSLLTVDIKNFKAMWNEEVYQNRERWKAQACKGTVHTVKWGGGFVLTKLIFQIYQNGRNWLTMLQCPERLPSSWLLTQGGIFTDLYLWGISCLTCATVFFGCDDYSDNKFGLKWFRCPLYGSIVREEIKPVSFTDSWFISD